MFTMLLVSRVDLFLYVNKSDMKCTTDVDSNEICLFEPCSETRLTSSVLEVGPPWTIMDYAGIFATKGKSLKTAGKLCNMQIKTDCNDLQIA